MEVTVQPSHGLKGELSIPPDKSISHRALIIGAISSGVSVIRNISCAEDPLSTRSCLEALGVLIEDFPGGVKIPGRGLRGLKMPSSSLNAGNSGTTMRMLTAVLAGQAFESVLIGDDSLSRRPMKRIIEPLRAMGAGVFGTDTHTAPIRIFPVHALHSIRYELPVPSAQVKSAVLLAGLYADGETTVAEQYPTRDHTERYLGLTVEKHGSRRNARVSGGFQPEAREMEIPGDFSAAAFFIAAALALPGSEIVIGNLGLNPTRIGLLDILLRMGGCVDIIDMRMSGGEPVGDIRVKSSPLKNLKVSGDVIPNVIDEIPVLALAATAGEGVFEVREAGDLRNKESDRIAAVVHTLRSLGVDVEEYEDGFAFEGPASLRGGVPLKSYRDHRIVMANAIAALRADGPTNVCDAECVAISFPGFWEEMTRMST